MSITFFKVHLNEASQSEKLKQWWEGQREGMVSMELFIPYQGKHFCLVMHVHTQPVTELDSKPLDEIAAHHPHQKRAVIFRSYQDIQHSPQTAFLKA